MDSTVDGMNPRKGAQRLIRWLQNPVEYDQPAFASEKGEKEERGYQSKL